MSRVWSPRYGNLTMTKPYYQVPEVYETKYVVHYSMCCLVIHACFCHFSVRAFSPPLGLESGLLLALSSAPPLDMSPEEAFERSADSCGIYEACEALLVLNWFPLTMPSSASDLDKREGSSTLPCVSHSNVYLQTFSNQPDLFRNLGQ